jgi:hypothetical protein
LRFFAAAGRFAAVFFAAGLPARFAAVRPFVDLRAGDFRNGFVTVSKTFSPNSFIFSMIVGSAGAFCDDVGFLAGADMAVIFVSHIIAAAMRRWLCTFLANEDGHWQGFYSATHPRRVISPSHDTIDLQGGDIPAASSRGSHLRMAARALFPMASAFSSPATVRPRVFVAAIHSYPWPVSRPAAASASAVTSTAAAPLPARPRSRLPAR